MAGSPGLFPEHTNNTLNRLSTIGERMTGDWATTKAEIAGLVGQLGQGELGSAFLAGYQQLATEIADAVDQCCRRPGEFANAGNHAVTGLVTIDNDNQQAIRSNPTSLT
jgi:hypothetical protein